MNCKNCDFFSPYGRWATDNSFGPCEKFGGRVHAKDGCPKGYPVQVRPVPLTFSADMSQGELREERQRLSAYKPNKERSA